MSHKNIDAICCPITMNPMVNPVLSPGGHSYEKSVITEWIKIKGESPMTRKVLSLDDLRPNIALRDIIEEITEKKTELTANADKTFVSPKSGKDGESLLVLCYYRGKRGKGNGYFLCTGR